MEIINYRIKLRSFILFLCLLVLAINCRWGEFIPFIPKVGNVYDIILIVVLFIICRLYHPIVKTIGPFVRKIDKIVAIMFALWGIELAYTVLVVGNSALDSFTWFAQWHLKILFVYPMLYTMKCFGINKVLKYIVWIQTVSIFVQALAAVVYNTTGSMMFEVIRSESWTRGGMIRISSSPLTCFIMIIFAVEALCAKKVLRKAKYLIYVTLLLLFTIFVNGGRSQYFAVLTAIAVVYMMNRRSSIKQIGAMIILIVAAYFVMESEWFANVVSGITEDYNSGTIDHRFQLMTLFFEKYDFLTILGRGYVGPSVWFGSRWFSFIDYGLLGDYLQFGVVSLVYYYLIIKSGFDAARKGNDNRYRLVAYGCVVYLIAGAVGYTQITGNRVILIPVLLSLFESIVYESKMRDNALK